MRSAVSQQMFMNELMRFEQPDLILYLKKISFSIINNTTVAEVRTSEGGEAARQFYVDVRFFKQTETCLRSFWEFAKCLTAVIDKQLKLYFLHCLFLALFLSSSLPSFLSSFITSPNLFSKQAGTSCQSADSYSEDGRFDPRPRRFVVIVLGCRRRKPRHCLNEATAALPHAVIN
jgi:hypothetical protein